VTCHVSSVELHLARMSAPMRSASEALGRLRGQGGLPRLLS